MFYDIVNNYRYEAIKGDIGLTEEQKRRLANILKNVAVDMVLDRHMNSYEKYRIYNKLLHIILDSSVGLIKILGWLEESTDDAIIKRIKQYKNVRVFIESDTETKLLLSKDYDFKPDYIAEMLSIKSILDRLAINCKDIVCSKETLSIRKEVYRNKLLNIENLIKNDKNPYIESSYKTKYIEMQSKLMSYIESVA